MSRKIIGVTVGTTLPKPNFKQTDPTKGDYIKNKPDFEGLKTNVEELKTLVGDIAVSEQIDTAIQKSVADWSQTDQTAVDYIKNKPDIATDEEIVELLMQVDMLPAITDANGSILFDEDDNILSW